VGLAVVGLPAVVGLTAEVVLVVVVVGLAAVAGLAAAAGLAAETGLPAVAGLVCALRVSTKIIPVIPNKIFFMYCVLNFYFNYLSKALS
jgi:hypothetical protein